MTARSPAAAFDVCGPLPTGVTVLEASAGTGKTYTIAALAARYVAEGTPLERLLLVTFTRMATGELRERVRERLVSAERGLGPALAGAPPRERRGRARCSPTGRRRGRARAASGSRARSPTSTPRRSPPPTASARRCSAASGIAGDLEPDVDVRRGPRATCVDEVVDDLYVRRFHRGDAPAVRPRARRGRSPAPRSTTRRRRSSRGDAGDGRRRCAARLAGAVRDELERAQARAWR